MTKFIILLRGIMPTGKNKVLMAPLRTALTSAGLRDVQTYIQSGNVLASTDLDQALLEKLTYQVILESFGAEISVIAKKPNQLSRILEQNPFTNFDEGKLYFSILSKKPDNNLLVEFSSINFEPDRVQLLNNTIYTLYSTKHSDSKFNNNYFERKLKVRATTRNFNTITKLVALSKA